MEIIRHRPHYNKYYYYGKPPITRESGGKEEGRLSEAEAGVEEAKKAERKKSPAFAGGRKTERMERASGAPSKCAKRTALGAHSERNERSRPAA